MSPSKSMALGLGGKIAMHAIRTTVLGSTPLFVTRYFKDAEGNPIKLEKFHVDMYDAIESELDKNPHDPTRPRVILVEMPAAHGKTTNLSRFLPIKLMVKNPNIRIMHIMNNSTDAEQNLAAIQQEMEDERNPLVQELGPFKGKVWKATEFHVAGRTITDPNPTFSAFGTGTNVFGHRADVAICDDILNLENSGPFASERTRQSVEDWFFQGVMKVVAPNGIVIVIGTVQDFRDLYHKLEKMPDVKVIKFQAIIDEESKTVLWPSRFSYEWLSREREMDLTSFLKRFQNIALEESLLTFPMQDLLACRNFERSWGEITEKMRAEGATVVVNAFDPTAGQTKGSKWCGFASIAFNPKQAEPRKYYFLELYHFRGTFDEQIQFIIEKHKKYNARATVIEANGAHQYLMQSNELRAFRNSGNIVDPHYTDRSNKPDPYVGVPSLGPICKAHLFDFPYADEASRGWVNHFIEKEWGQHPMASTTDSIMAAWFAVMRARALGSWGGRVIRRGIPSWASRAGMSSSALAGRRVVTRA